MLSCLTKISRLSVKPEEWNRRFLYLSQINPAARKGTREKARKKKVKVEVQKIGFIPHNQRNRDKLNLNLQDKHVDDSWKAIPNDNVYIGRYYQWRVYSVTDAISCHRETNHPTMYGVPNAPLNVEIELNMQGEKKTRFVDNFQRIAMIPHKFNHGEERNILVLAKGEDILKQASEAGAALVGGADIVKNIHSGDIKISDYQFVLAHPNIMPEMVTVRGLMRKKFPNPKNGTLGINLPEMVVQFLNGIQYSAAKDEHQQNFGIIKTCIGNLTMDSNHLEQNLTALLKDIDALRPKRDGKFISRVILKSPPSGENLKINPFLYVSENNPKFAKTRETADKLEPLTTDDKDGEEIVEKVANVN